MMVHFSSVIGQLLTTVVLLQHRDYNMVPSADVLCTAKATPGIITQALQQLIWVRIQLTKLLLIVCDKFELHVHLCSQQLTFVLSRTWSDLEWCRLGTCIHRCCTDILDHCCCCTYTHAHVHKSSTLHVMTMNVVGLLCTDVTKTKLNDYLYIVRPTAWCKCAPWKNMEPS